MATIQTGIKNTNKDYTQFSYFLGGIDVTEQNLDQFTPYIQGISRIFMHRVPDLLTKFDAKTTNKHNIVKKFKSILETGFTSIQGIGDVSVDFVTFEGGFNADTYSTVSSSKDETDSLTITVFEQSGSPVRECLDVWVSGTRDPRTGVAHYHGLNKDASNVAHYVSYGEKSHTAEFMYITMDPTAQEIEYACLFAQCFPTKVPKSHLNFESGNREKVQMDVEFRTKKYESPAINLMGNMYLATSLINYNYLSFTPFNPAEKDDKDKTKYAIEQKIREGRAGYDYGATTWTLE